MVRFAKKGEKAVQKTFLVLLLLGLFLFLPMWAVRRRRARRTVRVDELPVPSEKVRRLAADPSRKIDAIREYRQETGLGLLEAKEMIENLIGDR